MTLWTCVAPKEAAQEVRDDVHQKLYDRPDHLDLMSAATSPQFRIRQGKTLTLYYPVK